MLQLRNNSLPSLLWLTSRVVLGLGFLRVRVSGTKDTTINYDTLHNHGGNEAMLSYV